MGQAPIFTCRISQKNYLEDPGGMTKDSALMTFVQDAAACNRTADTFEIVFDSKAWGAAGSSLEISLILSPCGILCLFGWYFLTL